MTRRQVTAEQKQRMREGCAKRVMPADRGANISRAKTHAIRTPEGVFPSVKSYSELLGVRPITIYKRMKRYPELYGFVL
jgi:transcriptional regulator of acetoin/glycerol metabolism